MAAALKRIHHVGISAGDPAEDRAFHEEVLGLRLAHSAELGNSRVHQLYDTGSGEAGTVVSSLCLGENGGPGRRGSNSPKVANLSVAPAALPFWRERLHEHHIESGSEDLLGGERVTFAHPSGVEYSLVAVAEDERTVNEHSEVPVEYAIRGLHSVTISLMDVREFTDFLLEVVGADHVDQDGGVGLFRLGDGPASLLEVIHEPYTAPGTWRYAAGTSHHVGLDAGGAGDRERLRGRIAERGYNDLSAASEQDHFSSMWLRAPGGVLVDLVATDASAP
jgi:glyoxalase family protein